jgi:hypothetical protein
MSLCIPSSSQSPDHDPHRTIYYLRYPLGRFASLKHRHHPRAMQELCGEAGVNSVTLCHPLSYGLHIAPLEGERRNPRKRYRCLPRACAGRCHDVRPAERVFSVTSALCGHPHRCAAISGTVVPSLALWDHRTTGHCRACYCVTPCPPSA